MKKLFNTGTFSRGMLTAVVAFFAVIGIVSAATTISNSVTVGADLTVDTDTLYVDSTNDRTGIGTSTIYSTLAVNATDGESALMIASSTGSGAVEEWLEVTSAGDLKVDTSDLVVDISASKVGIASSTPSAMLSVGDGSGSATSTIDVGIPCFRIKTYISGTLTEYYMWPSVSGTLGGWATSTASCF